MSEKEKQRIKEGLCVICGQPAEPHYTICKNCRDKWFERILSWCVDKHEKNVQGGQEAV